MLRMGYQVVDPDDVDPIEDRPCVTLPVGDSAGLENIGLRLYRVAPGEQMPLAYHYHDEQEEVFYVLTGTLHVETPDEEFEISAGRLFIAEPESPHLAFNPNGADGPVEVLALGAPPVDDVHPYEEGG